MKLNWNFLGGGGGVGGKQKTFCGGSMDILWNCTLYCSRKYLYPTQGRSLEILRGGVLKAKILKGKYEGKLEIQGGREGGVPTKIPSLGEVWILSGSHIHTV